MASNDLQRRRFRQKSVSEMKFLKINWFFSSYKFSFFLQSSHENGAADANDGDGSVGHGGDNGDDNKWLLIIIGCVVVCCLGSKFTELLRSYFLHKHFNFSFTSCRIPQLREPNVVGRRMLETFIERFSRILLK